MKTILYYFTGTGNSLAFARAIADRLPDTELIPIPMLLLGGEKIRAQKDANIGIISPLSAPPAKPEQKTIREDALRKVAVLTEAVRERRPQQIDLTTTGKLLRLVMYKPFMKNIPAFGKKFVVSSNCNGCMLCVDICPVNNIRVLPKGKKEWLDHCEGCLACLQFCPVEAISCGGKTDERPRKAHPAANTKNNPLFFSRPARQA